MRAIALLAVVALTVSCDAITGGKDGSFTLSLSDATLNLGQGKKDTVVITLARSSYTKPIALSVAGTPAGVTATLLAQTVPGNSSVTGLELSATGTATLATSTLTIKAVGAGVAEKTATVDVVVGVTGSFSLSSQGFPVTVAQGGGGIGTILVQRTGGHGDNVTLGAIGLPSGVTASFGASPTSSTSTAVSFTAAAGATPGTYNLTITGDAAGLTQQPTPVTINVIAPPATSTLTMVFCTTNVPSWFAYQNQGSLWQTATPVSGVFSFPATATLGVAYVFPASTQSTFVAYYGTRAELAARVPDCGSKTVTGSIGGAATGQSARVAMGVSGAAATQANPNFTLTSVANRALDLFSTKGVMTNTQFALQITPDKLFLQRGLNPASGANIGTLDFAAQGFAPASSNLTVANTTSADSINVGVTFLTATNTRGVVNVFQTASTSTSVFSVPSARLIGGDIHELLVETYRSDGSGRLNYSYLGALTDRTETLSPTLTAPTVSVISTTPYTRLRVQLPVQAEYPTLSFFEFQQDGGASAPTRVIDLVVSAGFLGATPATAWDLAIPEFGSVAGLSNSWLPSTAFLYLWAEADGGPALPLFGGTPAAGDALRWAYRQYSLGSLLRAGLSAGPRTPLGHQYLRR